MTQPPSTLALPAGMEINLPRLLADLDELNSIGAIPGVDGVQRVSFSPVDMEARHWLQQKMRELGLRSWLDPAGNVLGRWEIGKGAPLMVGSHLDSVPNGGPLDGALGVLAGLECCRCLKENDFQPVRPLELIATSEEEGRFGGMLGSQALTGNLEPQWLAQAKDDEGVLLTDTLAQAGLPSERIYQARRPPGDPWAFLELHVEQGPVLEQAGLPVGIVEGIAGVFHWNVEFRGQANHAGTTPMGLRRDALQALAAFIHRTPEWLSAAGNDSRLTIGKVEVSPNFPHTVPGLVRFSVVGKDVDTATMKQLARRCREGLTEVAAEHQVSWALEEISWLDSQPCAPALISLLEQLTQELQIPSMKLPSGAGHDTQFFAQHTQAGMIFVPSIKGISHAPEEATEARDIALGGKLLLHAVAVLLNKS